MKKICFFGGNISRAGGTERVTTIIANNLIRCGYDVYILSVASGMKSAFPLDQNVKLHSLAMEKYRANTSDFRIINRLRSFLRENQIDYVVDVDILLSLYSVLASCNLKTKVIAWEHFTCNVNVGDFFQRSRRTIARWLAVRHASVIVVLTNHDRLSYQNRYGRKVRITTVSNPLVRSSEQQAELKNKSVIAVGRLVHQKGFDLLLQAWALVNLKHSDWELKIVGSGPEKSKLSKLANELKIEEQVKFYEGVTDVNEYYLNSSIYVMSSRFEGFGVVLLEAKSFGLPIVSFDCEAGPSEIVKHDFDGLLVESGDVKALANGLLIFIEDQEKRVLFGRRAALDDRFDIDGIMEKWRGLLSS